MSRRGPFAQALCRGAGAVLCSALMLVGTGCRSSAPVIPGGPGAVTAALTATPSSGAAPLNVTLDASGSAGGAAPLRYDYDYDGDGVYDTSAAAASVHWSYANAGTFHATVRVTDAAGQTATAQATVSVTGSGNALPVATLALTPPGGNAPLDVTLDGSASTDSDGSLVRYDYDINNDGVWDAYDAGPSVHWNFDYGDYVVRLRVTDNGGAQSSTTQPLHVNSLPNAVIRVSQNPAPQGSTLTFNASDSLDIEGPITKYEWDADGNGTYELNKGTDPVLQILFPTAGTFHVGLRVTDNSGANRTDSLEIQITP